MGGLWIGSVKKFFPFFGYSWFFLLTNRTDTLLWRCRATRFFWGEGTLVVGMGGGVPLKNIKVGPCAGQAQEE